MSKLSMEELGERAMKRLASEKADLERLEAAVENAKQAVVVKRQVVHSLQETLGVSDEDMKKIQPLRSAGKSVGEFVVEALESLSGWATSAKIVDKIQDLAGGAAIKKASILAEISKLAKAGEIETQDYEGRGNKYRLKAASEEGGDEEGGDEEAEKKAKKKAEKKKAEAEKKKAEKKAEAEKKKKKAEKKKAEDGAEKKAKKKDEDDEEDEDDDFDLDDFDLDDDDEDGSDEEDEEDEEDPF